MTLKFLERLNDKLSSNVWRCSNSYYIYYYFGFFLVFFPTPCPNYNIISFFVFLIVFALSCFFHCACKMTLYHFLSMPVKCTRIEFNSSSCFFRLKLLCSPFLGLFHYFLTFFSLVLLFFFILLFAIVFFYNPSTISFFFSHFFFSFPTLL
jgi:hypothetical protein